MSDYIGKFTGAEIDERLEKVAKLNEQVGNLAVEVGKAVRYIDLSDYADGQLIPMSDAEGAKAPFLTRMSYVDASHYRTTAQYRFDCFLHGLREGMNEGYSYAILKLGMDESQETVGYTMLGYLAIEPDSIVLRNNSSEEVETIEGKNAQQWKDYILPLFGEDLREKVENLEEDSKRLSDLVDKVGIVEEEVYSDNGSLPLLCGQPQKLFGAGTPQEAIVPDNWKQYDPETDTGYNWNGLPSAVGQEYYNTTATTNGKYTAYMKADGTLAWLNF